MPVAADPLFHCLSMGRLGTNPRNELEAGPAPPRWRQEASSVLIFHHARGGGSSRFLEGYERCIFEAGQNVLRVRAVDKAPSLAVVDGCVMDLERDRDDLVDFARQRRVARLVVNHLVDRPPAMADWVQALAAKLGVPYEVVLHDYYVLCPRLDLVRGDTTFCGIAPVEACGQCVKRYGAEVEHFEPNSWRMNNLAFLENAVQITVPSRDLATRLQPYLKKQLTIWQPEDDNARRLT
jgi:hypothetical protein